MSLVLLLTLACGGGGGRRRAPQVSLPPAPAPSGLQSLFESGQYGEVIRRLGSSLPSAPPEDLFWLGHSYRKLSQPAAAQSTFERLSEHPSESWAMVGRLALTDDQAVLQHAAGLSGAAFVQFQLGLALVDQGAAAEAAEAFDRCARANPRLAYSYYYAGLAYERLRRMDRMAARFEIFLRLAPDAPERPQVEAVLRTIRGH